MKQGLIAVPGILLGFMMVIAAPRAVSQESTGKAKLQVKVNYTGSGTVDGKHKIWVVLWDSPEFVHGNVEPVELSPTLSKDGSVTFDDVKKSPGYLSAAFDPKGEWDGQSGPPPEGTSLGLYSKTQGKPEPVELKAGKTVTVELTFDDTVKMQGGTPQR